MTRSRSWSFVERPGLLLVVAFIIAQLVSQLPVHFILGSLLLVKRKNWSLIFHCKQIATLIAVYASWSFAFIEGIGWGWAGVIWLYNLIFYFPLDIIKFLIRYALSGRAWDLVIEQRVWMALVCWSTLFSGIFVIICFWLISLSCRLLSQDKRTSGRNSVSFNGHMHREHCMGCSHLTPRCLLSEYISQNSIKWLKKPKEELKLQGRRWS